MKRSFLLPLILLPFAAICQSNYQKGFYVNLKGDTVNGFIDHREWFHNPQNINFKPGLNSAQQQLGINDIDYFGVEGYEYYKRYTVSLSMDGVELSNAPIGADNTIKTNTVFLRVLQTGQNVTLFSFRDVLKTRFYVMDHSMNIPQELGYKVYMNPDGSNSLVIRKYFIDQLNLLAIKHHVSSRITQKIKNTQYREEDLTKIIYAINGSAGEDMPGKSQDQQVNQPVHSRKNRFFIGAALNLSSLKYDKGSPFPTSTPSHSAGIRLAAGIDANLKPNVNRFIFRAELAYSSASYSFTSTDNETYNNAQRTTTQKLRQWTIAGTPQLIWNFYATDPLKVFLGAGFSVNLSSYPTNQYGSTSPGDNNPKENYPEMKRFWFCIPVKAGIVLNGKLEIFGTVIPPVKLDNYYKDFTASLFVCQAGVNFLFGK